MNEFIGLLVVMLVVGTIRSNPMREMDVNSQILDDKSQPFVEDPLLKLAINETRSSLQATSKQETSGNELEKPSIEEVILKMIVKTLFSERSDQDMDQLLLDISGNDKQLGLLFGNGNGLLGNFWNLITKRNKRRRIQNFLRQKGNLFLHAASIGASIAALSTAISVSAAAAHKVHNHNHEVLLNDDFVLEPVFQRSSYVDTSALPIYPSPEFLNETFRRATNRQLEAAEEQSPPGTNSNDLKLQ